MIRRFVLLSTLSLGGLLALGAGPAPARPAERASSPYIACAYKSTPIDIGVCISSPI
jgi:hypothetical protein